MYFYFIRNASWLGMLVCSMSMVITAKAFTFPSGLPNLSMQIQPLSLMPILTFCSWNLPWTDITFHFLCRFACALWTFLDLHYFNILCLSSYSIYSLLRFSFLRRQLCILSVYCSTENTYIGKFETNSVEEITHCDPCLPSPTLPKLSQHPHDMTT